MHNGAIMASEVAHRLDAGGPYPVVQLTGVLDADAGPAARSALLEVLAGQPEALIVDVSGLHLAHPGATAALRDVARLNAAWPDAHIVLCASQDAERWHSTGLPVWPDRAQAMAELGEPETGTRLSLHLEPMVGAARRARELVTEACGRWDCPELAGPACIVITEMVNNVVAHAHTPMTVLLAAHAATDERGGPRPVRADAQLHRDRAGADLVRRPWPAAHRLGVQPLGQPRAGRRQGGLGGAGRGGGGAGPAGGQIRGAGMADPARG